MSLLAANLEALEKYYPDLARRLATETRRPERGQWSASRAGPATVRLNGQALASAFDPVLEAQRAVPEWGDEAVFAMLPGLGVGYLAEAVSERYADLTIIIAEADSHWFREVLAHRDLSGLWSRVVPLLGPDAGVVGDFLAAFVCRSVPILPWRPLAQQDPDWQDAVTDQVARAQARAGVNWATYRRFADLWRRNLHKNEALARDVRPLAALAAREDGHPAVIAAAGPSLAETIPWMKAHRDQFVLVVVDTAWSSLAHWGLEPDYLLVMDGQYWNARHVDRLPPSRTLVVTEWTGPPRAFRLAPGRTFVAASSVPFLRSREQLIWGALGALPSGGSVATAAWSLVLHLGCSQVAFAGLDLGYPEGQTHVAGSQFEETLHRRSFRVSPAETQGLVLRGLSGLRGRPAADGGLVLSDDRMDLFRDWLVRSFRANPEVQVFNLGTRGSLIEGARHTPVDFGDRWPAIQHSQLHTAPIARRPDSSNRPPFGALRQVLTAANFEEAVVQAWSAASDYWGQNVWDAWAGRAWNTWRRFPSSRSQRAVLEAVELALTWEAFWKDEGRFM